MDLEINDEPVDLQMKLGEAGEAFFVQQTENFTEEVRNINLQSHSLHICVDTSKTLMVNTQVC